MTYLPCWIQMPIPIPIWTATRYIVLRRTFRTTLSQIQIPNLIANYRNGIGIGSESESRSDNVNNPKGLRFAIM